LQRRSFLTKTVFKIFISSLPAEINIAVESEAMAGDEVAVVDSHCADFVVADPDSGVRRSESRQPETDAQAIDHRLKMITK
jgi:hypothetical protein